MAAIEVHNPEPTYILTLTRSETLEIYRALNDLKSGSTNAVFEVREALYQLGFRMKEEWAT